jgi:hypothetical protein
VNRLEAALIDVARHLEGSGVPYMVFGGFANLHWGRSRLTEDLDVKVRLDQSRWPEFLAGLGRRFRVLPADALAFAHETHVIPIETPTRVRVDLVLAVLPYEEEAIRRAVVLPVGPATVRLCTAEDLILHKIVSERARDRDDVEGVVLRRGALLDRDYLDPRIHELAAGLERPEIASYYHECLRKAGIVAALPEADE